LVKVSNTKDAPNVLIFAQKTFHIFLKISRYFSQIYFDFSVDWKIYFRKTKIYFFLRRLGPSTRPDPLVVPSLHTAAMWARALAWPTHQPPFPPCAAHSLGDSFPNPPPHLVPRARPPLAAAYGAYLHTPFCGEPPSPVPPLPAFATRRVDGWSPLPRHPRDPAQIAARDNIHHPD
jgi:hypothetical protein